MACEPTNNTGTNARCDRSCSGVCNAGAIGCTHGLTVLRSTEDGLPLIGFAPTPRSSGQPATVARLATGAERDELANGQTVTVRCTDCTEGQGDDCHCWRAADPRTMRWLLIALVACWGLVVWGIRSCAA